MTRHEAIQEVRRWLVSSTGPFGFIGSAPRPAARPGQTATSTSWSSCLTLPPGRSSAVPGSTPRCRESLIPWKSSAGGKDFEGRAAYVVASLPATVTREGKLLYDSRRLAA